MNAQLQFNDRLYDARITYRPTETGGVMALTTELYPPYPDLGEYVVIIYLDGYRVNNTMVEWGDHSDRPYVTLEQLIELDFNRVPDPE